MHSVAFNEDYSLTPVNLLKEVKGYPLSCFADGEDYFMVLAKADPHADKQSDCVSEQLVVEAYDSRFLVDTENFFILKGRSLELSHNLLPQDKKQDFLRIALTSFRKDCEAFYSKVITRLKGKQSGGGSMIDLENIRYSMADYYRFIFNLQTIESEEFINNLFVSELVFDSSETLSNMLGGISVLADGSVEMHTQFSMLMTDVGENT